MNDKDMLPIVAVAAGLGVVLYALSKRESLTPWRDEDYYSYYGGGLWPKDEDDGGDDGGGEIPDGEDDGGGDDGGTVVAYGEHLYLSAFASIDAYLKYVRSLGDTPETRAALKGELGWTDAQIDAFWAAPTCPQCGRETTSVSVRQYLGLERRDYIDDPCSYYFPKWGSLQSREFCTFCDRLLCSSTALSGQRSSITYTSAKCTTLGGTNTYTNTIDDIFACGTVKYQLRDRRR